MRIPTDGGHCGAPTEQRWEVRNRYDRDARLLGQYWGRVEVCTKHPDSWGKPLPRV